MSILLYSKRFSFMEGVTFVFLLAAVSTGLYGMNRQIPGLPLAPKQANPNPLPLGEETGKWGDVLDFRSDISNCYHCSKLPVFEREDDFYENNDSDTESNPDSEWTDYLSDNCSDLSSGDFSPEDKGPVFGENSVLGKRKRDFLYCDYPSKKRKTEGADEPNDEASDEPKFCHIIVDGMDQVKIFDGGKYRTNILECSSEYVSLTLDTVFLNNIPTIIYLIKSVQENGAKVVGLILKNITSPITFFNKFADSCKERNVRLYETVFLCVKNCYGERVNPKNTKQARRKLFEFPTQPTSSLVDFAISATSVDLPFVESTDDRGEEYFYYFRSKDHL